MGASISTWARWDDNAIRDGQLRDTPETQPPSPPPALVAKRDDKQVAFDQTRDDTAAQRRNEPLQEAGHVFQSASPSGAVTHNYGASLFQAAQNLTIHGGSYTMTVQQTGSDVDREYLRKVLDFLSLANFRSIQAENLVKWTEGTLKAFIEGNMFQLWLVTHCAILWGTGMPGAGKTILASVIIQYLETYASTHTDICVAFVYCRYTEPMAVRDILAALVRQLVDGYPHLLPVVEPTYQKHERHKTKPTQSELLDLIRHICSLFRMAFFSIDGLDEALYDEQFDLLDALTSIKANFVITSRPLVRLKDVLPNAEFFEIAAQAGDIELLVSQHIDRSPDLRQILNTGEGRKQVIKEICEASQGMFLHASLMVEVIRQCTSVASVMKQLDKLPPKLDVLYDEAFKRIEAQGEERASLAKRVLMWVAYAIHPLGVQDLRYAVAVDLQTDWADEDSLVPESLLISICCGLATIEEFSNGRNVRLVHYTALDPLRRLLDLSERLPHCSLATVCIERLIFCDVANVGDSDMLGGLFRQHALLRFAYASWHYHARKAFLNLTQPGIEPLPSILRFLLSCTSFPVLLTSGAWDSEYGRVRATNQFDIFTSSIHFLSFYSLPSLLPFIDPLINKPTTNGRSALSLAVHCEDSAMVELLLKRDDININAQYKSGSTALVDAASMGNAHIVAILLRDPRIDAKGFSIALRYALAPPLPCILPGHTQAALHLISAPGIEINSFDYPLIGPPLMYAVQHPPHLLDSLIQHPHINLCMTDIIGMTPLMSTCFFGSSSGIRQYLQLPEVNARDRSGATALFHRARYWGPPGRENYPLDCYLSDFRMLVDAGIGVNDRDLQGSTALTDAVWRGNLEPAKALLQVEGVDTKPRDNMGRTLLMIACAEQHLDMLNLLYDLPGANINAKDLNGRTALMYLFLQPAYRKDRSKDTGMIAHTLFRQPELKVEVKDNFGMTALAHAAVKGVFRTATTLIAEMAQANYITDCRKDGRRHIALYRTASPNATPSFEIFEIPELAVRLRAWEHFNGEKSPSSVLLVANPADHQGRSSPAPWRWHMVESGHGLTCIDLERGWRRMARLGLGFPWVRPWICKEDVVYAKILLGHPEIDDSGLGFLRDILTGEDDNSERS